METGKGEPTKEQDPIDFAVDGFIRNLIDDDETIRERGIQTAADFLRANPMDIPDFNAELLKKNGDRGRNTVDQISLIMMALLKKN